MSCACLEPRHPPTRTINIVHLTQQHWIQLLTSLAMTRFGLSIEAELRVSRPSIEHQVLGFQRPSIGPLTFPCRADTLRVMPWTRVVIQQVTLLKKKFSSNNRIKRLIKQHRFNTKIINSCGFISDSLGYQQRIYSLCWAFFNPYST